ncbi:MAG: 16S rRNA (cytosine(1402)-N(4))-methyltransferase RsmH [Clostridia bacterium]|nr:16S rRNA (cytosine(1402)-N(4))-methyltransferase RsmH [Clostridia bacterium]MBQ7047211.1 16S rRNA (cytosine(1402)-N(4))-methyltransferase RsmH [Oscillospiraceae bacterium]
MDFKHIPVLFEESIAALNIKADGIYVDCTAGGGGHSSAVADRLSANGRLIAIDRDPQAIQTLTGRFEGRENITIVNDNFFNIKGITESLGISGVDGILADLGVSSHQLDDASRGFSFHSDAPLDMRMSMQGMSAADAVNSLSQQELQKIIYKFGEEKFAPRIASAIVRQRQIKPIETTLELADIIKSAIPAAARREGGHPARRTFQALRIYVNGELDGLSQALLDMFESLNVGGRLAVITFHSLEDRAVKQTFASLCEGCTCPPEFPVCVCGKESRGALPQKALAPTDEEIEENPRSRSARLRVIERKR